MPPKPGRPKITAFGVSIAIHGALAVVLLVLAGMKPEPVSTKAQPIHTDLVFLQHTAGPGGGGGGRPTPAPPSKLQIPEHVQPTVAIPSAVVTVDPPPVLDVQIQPNATMLQGSGVILGAPPGPGGGGPGTGVGPGTGPGAGPGEKGGTGGREKGDGAVTPAVPLRQPKPAYTPGALAAKIQGSVTLEVEVLANGTVGNVRVIKSLDRIYGLDQEAIKAAKNWFFIPGRSGGRPVDTIVHIILDFNLR
ncbi:MAG TPA: energy transducer TonB [Vicinamibacterales bacterium]|nr:energy transducer TonB [Vicinamibacterales bacterium]